MQLREVVGIFELEPIESSNEDLPPLRFRIEITRARKEKKPYHIAAYRHEAFRMSPRFGSHSLREKWRSDETVLVEDFQLDWESIKEESAVKALRRALGLISTQLRLSNKRNGKDTK